MYLQINDHIPFLAASTLTIYSILVDLSSHLTKFIGHATINHMVKHYSQQLDRTFFAVSDPTRRAILGNLAAKGRCSVLELAAPFNMSVPAISKHLKLLENANLINRQRQGRVHYLKLCPEPMREANDWLATYSQFWKMQLDSLQDYMLERVKGEDKDEFNRNKTNDRRGKQRNKRAR